MFNRNKLADLADKGASLARSTAAKVGAAGTALMASGAAFAGGGASSPGGAIAAELSGGKADVLLIIGAVAVILGVIVLWGYVKRAR